MKIEDVRKNFKRSESKILAVCCEYLRARKHFFWRQNNHGVYDPKIEAYRSNRNTMRGVPDIFLMKYELISVDRGVCKDLMRFPVMFAIEVKTDKGKLSPEQKVFQKAWTERAGIFIVARSVDDLIKAGL